MEINNAASLSVVQHLTEFFSVGSSIHLPFFQYPFG